MTIKHRITTKQAAVLSAAVKEQQSDANDECERSRKSSASEAVVRRVRMEQKATTCSRYSRNRR